MQVAAAALSLAVASTGIELINEFQAAIPKDQNYASRMDSLAKTKNGLITMLEGAITALSERTFYSDASIEKMVRGIREYYPAFNSALSETARSEYRARIEKLYGRESNAAVEQELMSLVTAMKVDPKAAANHAKATP